MILHQTIYDICLIIQPSKHEYFREGQFQKYSINTTVFDEIVKGKTVEHVPQDLNYLFRSSVQPYLISWFKYNPQKEIAKLKIPVLIVQGTTDIQVGLDDANRLLKALPGSKLVVIEGMNHIMKEAPADRQLNILTYTQSDLPLKKELISNLIPFILGKYHGYSVQ